MSPSRIRVSASRLSPLLLGFLVACADPVAAPTVTSTPTAEPASPSPTVSEAPTPSPTTDPTAEPTESDDPTAERQQDISWAIPFTMTTPGDWRQDPLGPPTGQTFVMATGVDRWLVFHRPDAATVDEALEAFTSRATLAVGEPAAIEIGGMSGVAIDVQLAEDSPSDEVVLFGEASWGDWLLERGRPTRIWLMDVNDDVLMILTDAPEGAYESWMTVVEAALSTLEWGS